MPLEEPVKKVDYIIFNLIKRGRGRSRRIFEEVIERDLIVNKIFKDLVFNRTE